MADNTTKIQHNISSNLNHIDYRQTNTYINIMAKTSIKSNVIDKYWFNENGETVLTDAIYGKPKKIKKTTLSY